jgi:hypothetical protein
MIDIFSTSQVMLRDAGYSVVLVDVVGTSVICFEDDSLVGFCVTFASAGILLEEWREKEVKILNRFAPGIRVSGEKAWNVYVVFLTADTADDKQNRAIHWIEEDLDRTRKIASANIGTREDLSQALLAILPLQQQPILEPEDATDRLQRRIQSIAPVVENVFFDETIPAIEIVRLLEGLK